MMGKMERITGVVAAVSLKYKKFRFRVGEEWFEAKKEAVKAIVTPELKGCKVNVRYVDISDVLFIEILEKPVQGGRSDETSKKIVRQNVLGHATRIVLAEKPSEIKFLDSKISKDAPLDKKVELIKKVAEDLEEWVNR